MKMLNGQDEIWFMENLWMYIQLIETYFCSEAVETRIFIISASSHNNNIDHR